MDQVKVICKDHDSSEVGLFRYIVDGRIKDLPTSNPGST